MYEIVFKKRSLNNLFSLPEAVKKKFQKVLNILENNPNDRKYTVKIKNYSDIRRIKVTREYRLLYSCDKSCVTLLKIVKREKDTYKPIFMDRLGEEDIPSVLEDNENADEQQESTFLFQSQLERWSIPLEYRESLLELNKTKNEQEFGDSLLNINIPDKWKSRIIDNLYSTSIDVIKTEPDLVWKNPKDLDDFLSGKLTDFLLRLSSEQQKILNTNNDVPTLVKGGPGTGKSILAIYKIEKLLDSGVKKILFTTHTNTLAKSSQQLIYSLLRKHPKELGIEIDIVDNIAQKYYTKVYGEPNIASNKILLFYLESAVDTSNIRADYLRKIKQLGYSYLLEEMLIVIEARGIKDRRRYRETCRFGRKYPLKREFRDLIWSIYEKWQYFLANAGLITIEQLRRKALEVVVNQTQKKSKPYDAIVIDEAQDLSPVALKFLAELVSSNDGLYLTADTEQSLYQKSFSWDHIQANLKQKGKTYILKKNFRNTSQIGKACVEILNSREIKNFSSVQGDKPRIILTDDLLEQSRSLERYFERESQEHRLPKFAAGVILTPNSDYGKLLANQLTFNGTPAKYIEQQDIGETRNCLKILNLHSAKGLGFPFVAIVGLKEGLLPRCTKHIPLEERNEFILQEHRLFYVGCTRAMRSLLVIGSKLSPSQFIKPLIENSYWQVEVS